ncbi:MULTISPECIES: hypothetical protein [unclassified Colwellia]|uniref:hypothetical protein n=1 Tax=unclassified Colwellia TaxID=196834 RepID=UPI0015F5DFBA|nr:MULTISPECIES: hypothetical protein [unclassified Colwellia]MBA6287452.1 hypothetical protein [Colwellia sp. MB3u-4]MBA6296281.1 hypothetical protein [Colwellia sp. MB02u-9]
MFYKCMFYCSMLFMLISCGNDDKALSLPPAVDLNTETIANNVGDADIGGANTDTNENDGLTDNDLDDSDIGRTNTDTSEDAELPDNDIDDSDPVG